MEPRNFEAGENITAVGAPHLEDVGRIQQSVFRQYVEVCRALNSHPQFEGKQGVVEDVLREIDEYHRTRQILFTQRMQLRNILLQGTHEN